MADRSGLLSAAAREFVPCLSFSKASGLATINEDSTFKTPTLSGFTEPIKTAPKSQLMADSKPFVPAMVLSTPDKSKVEVKSMTPQTEGGLFIPRIIVRPVDLASSKSATSLPRPMCGVQQLLMTDDFSAEESPLQGQVPRHCALSLPSSVKRAKTCPLPSRSQGKRKKSVPNVQAEIERVCGLLEKSLESISERNLPTKLSQCTRIVFYFPQTLERAAATVERMALGRDCKLKCSLGVLVSFCCALSKQWPSFKNESDGSYRSLATAVVSRCKKRSETIHRLRRESDHSPLLQRAWVNDLTVICRLMIEFDFRSAGEVSAGLIADSLGALVPASTEEEWMLAVLVCVLRYSGKRLESRRRAVVEELFAKVTLLAGSEHCDALVKSLVELRKNEWRGSRKWRERRDQSEQVRIVLKQGWSKALSKHPLWPCLGAARPWKSGVFVSESLAVMLTVEDSTDQSVIAASLATLMEAGHISESDISSGLCQTSLKYGVESETAFACCLREWCLEKRCLSLESGLAAVREGCPELADQLRLSLLQ